MRRVLLVVLVISLVWLSCGYCLTYSVKPYVAKGEDGVMAVTVILTPITDPASTPTVTVAPTVATPSVPAPVVSQPATVPDFSK